MSKTSFAELWEMVCLKEDHLYFEYDEKENSEKSLTFIKQDPGFWDKLAQLSRTNPQDLAELLDTKEEDIVKWYGKIKEVQEVADREKAENDKDTMISTGDKL